MWPFLGIACLIPRNQNSMKHESSMCKSGWPNGLYLRVPACSLTQASITLVGSVRGHLRAGGCTA